MAGKAEIPELERFTFFPGQRLTATDLTELRRAHQELRQLHNRSLHNWGIGVGLEVSGERGDSSVTIGPGYGVDCLGREIILTASRMKTVPAVASGPGGGEALYYLVAEYLEDKDQKVMERRPGVCLPEGTVRLSEEPLIDWRRPDQLKEGLELILAQAWILNCQLSRDLALTARRYARPSQQPYIAAGQTRKGNTIWAAWRDENNQAIGVLTHVDTSPARFRTTPRYMAHVAGERYLPGRAGPPPASLQPLLLVGFTEIIDATPESFTVRVALPTNFPPPVNQIISPDLVKELGWHVVWMGIEA